MSWRTEAPIDSERRAYLSGRRAITAHTGSGVYPFEGVELSRADVEWLLETRGDRPEPADRGGERPCPGLDLRGALLQQVNLSNLPLARMQGGRSWLVCPSLTEEQRDQARVHLEGADLGGAHLQECFLGGAHLQECFLGGAHLQRAYLEGAHLEGADLAGADLEGADLAGAHLEGANLAGASLRGVPVPAGFLRRVRHWDRDILTPANLQGAFFDERTVLEDIALGDGQSGFVSLADVHWGGVNLSVVDWEAVTMLGDERRGRQTRWLYNYQAAVRAYRQLAAALREQGLHEAAARFAYRALVVQRRVLWRQMLRLRRKGRKGMWGLAQKTVDYLFSWLLDVCAGYGYRPLRSLITYLLVIGACTAIYYGQGMAYGPHLSWAQSLILSMTAFHGRAFFPAQVGPGGAQAFACAAESFVGLVVEVVLVVTFARRFLRK